MPWLAGLICLLLPIVGFAETLLHFPSDLEIKLEQDSPRFNLKTRRLGNLRIALRPNQITKDNSPGHYRGYLYRRGKDYLVAASIVGDNLELQFRLARNLRRAPRLSSISLPLNGKSTAYLSQVSSHVSKPCGNQDEMYPTTRLSTISRALPFTPLKYVEISTDADFQYFKAYRNKTLKRIQSILNAVDVLYMNQLGIKISIVSQHVFNTKRNPYKTTSSFSLLNAFKSYTEDNDHLGVADTYHLFTGKSLKQSIIGLAFVGKVCKEVQNSYGLTQKVNSSIQALVAAHEFGHLFGATHPEDSLSSPKPSLMTGIVKAGNTSFSNFSLSQIDSHFTSNNSCLSDSPGKSLDIDLSFNRVSNSIEVSSVATAFDTLADCTHTIQASSKLSTLLRLNGTVIETKAVSAANNFSSIAWPNSSKRRSKVFFRAVFSCGTGGTFTSTIKKLRLPGKSRKNINQALRTF